MLESSQRGVSAITYFSQNSEKNRNFFVNKFTQQKLQTGLG